MRNIDLIKKQKLLEQKYKLYLSKSPRPQGKLSNEYNLLDDLNIKDKAMMKEVKNYIRLKSGR